MAATLHYNLSGEFATEVIGVGERTRVGSASFCNTNATLPCFIDMYKKKEGLGTFYIIKNIKLPAGASFEVSGFNFNNTSEGFNLYVKLTKSASETPTVDLILK